MSHIDEELPSDPESSVADGVIREQEERDALRRVAGLSTELEDVSEAEYRQLRLERVVLVGVWTEGTAKAAEQSLAELARLAETAGSEVLDALIQRRRTPDASTYIGSGKAQELTAVVAALGADTVICDGELSPAQLEHLEKVVKVKVVDRTLLILDIFAQHARSREGKAQVSMAQMEYMLPRLRGWGQALSRQTNKIGGRGPGETKIETDRRRIRNRMAKLRRELDAMAMSRETSRSARKKSVTPAVAIVGYTNAGKSSLLNRFTSSTVLVRDELFATVDPTVRRSKTPGGREFTIADTVGFVRHLPHTLVQSFRSTMEEVLDADVLIHVVDGASPDAGDQIAAVRQVLVDVGAQDIPELVVINKSDQISEEDLTVFRHTEPNHFLVSAMNGDGISELLLGIEDALPHPNVEIDLVIPYDRAELVAKVHREGEIESINHTETGTRVHARVGDALAHEIRMASSIDDG